MHVSEHSLDSLFSLHVLEALQDVGECLISGLIVAVECVVMA